MIMMKRLSHLDVPMVTDQTKDHITAESTYIHWCLFPEQLLLRGLNVDKSSGRGAKQSVILSQAKCNLCEHICIALLNN